MIVDCHTHLFPHEVIQERERFLALEPTFREIYGDEKAKLASADDLLRSMDEAGIDLSVALGFAWRDVDLCRRHNDYLLEASVKSGGHIVAFCTLPLSAGPSAVVTEAERCVAAGALGFGELRPDSNGVDLNTPELAAALKQAAGADRTLLFHVSEPVGHAYPGKQGLLLEAFYRFTQAHPETRIVGAHWGGGLPFYALMPEVRLALANTSFDTAGTSLLYAPGIYRRAIELVGAGSIVFGSDFPLLSQARSRQRIEEAGLDDAERDAILGANAARLLGLE
jgi:predicted TIM-barrel fold metal-dependent hydrolase